MLRNFFFYLIATPATLILCIVAWIFPCIGTWVMDFWGRLMLFAAGVRYDVDMGGLDPSKTYVFMCNHQSNLDIPFLSHFLRDFGVRFVAKESLFSIPFFGPAIRRVGHISIDRTNRRKAMRSIETAVSKIQSGTSVIIFPEGTRATTYGELQHFKVGGMIIALKTGVPVVPMVMRSTGEVMPKGSGRVRSRHITLRALAPIDAASRYTLKERETFKDNLYTMMNTAYQELPHG